MLGFPRRKQPHGSMVAIDAHGGSARLFTTDSDAIAAMILVIAEAVAVPYRANGKFFMKVKTAPADNESFNESEWLAQLVLATSPTVEMVGTYQKRTTDGNVDSEYVFRKKEPIPATV